MAAVQALYQIDVTNSTAERVLDEFVRFRLESGGRTSDGSVPGGADRTLFLDIVRGVTARAEELDEILGAAITERWTVARLDPVLRAMLRAGVYELFAREDIPAKVAISEYVDVAHAFFEDREPGLVNGVLDRVARTLRRDGAGAAPEGSPASNGA